MAYPDTTRTKKPLGPPLRLPVDRKEDDATGINVEGRQPIDPRMPHMPPA
jgi:hypothetical protein